MKGNPTVHIIAGPNGSGKTTFAREFLPFFAHCDLFVNADLIAQGLSPLSPVTSNLQAGRLVLSRIRELAKRKKNFGFETTLSGKTYLNLIRKLKAKGYEVKIYFLWLRNVNLSLKRIRERVKKGGHHVPNHDVRRRYKSGLRNLLKLYQPLCDSVTIIDNSTPTPAILAIGNSIDLTPIDSYLFNEFKKTASIREN